MKRYKNRGVNTDYSSWPIEVKQQVACKTKFSIDKQVVGTLLNSDAHNNYSVIYDHIKMSIDYSPEVQNIFKDIFSTFSLDRKDSWFVIAKPNDDIWPHFDPSRTAGLYIPLTPHDDEYAPMEFYYKNKIYGVNNEDRYRVWIVNTSITHAVFNNNHERLNFQCNFWGIPFEDIVKKYEEFMEF